MTLESTIASRSTPPPSEGRWGLLTPAEWLEYEAEWKADRALQSIEVALRGSGYSRRTKRRQDDSEVDADTNRRRARRARAERLRDAARWVSPWDARKNQQSRIFQCGRVSQFGSNEDMYFGKRSNGDVSLYGTQSCGRHNQCAVCRLKTAAHHCDEIGTAIERWHELGRSVGFFTLTLRHTKEDELRALIEGLKDAWAMLTSGRMWNGWRTEHEAEYALSFEVLYNEVNGWHCHFHGLMFTPNQLDALQMREWLFERWSYVVAHCSSAKHVGTWRHFVDWETVEPGAKNLGRYLTKMGMELAGDLDKGARSIKSGRTLWDVLEDGRKAHEMAATYRAAERFEDAARLSSYASAQTAIWSHYVDAMYRVRWVSWSRRIRLELELGPELRDERSDEVAALDDEKTVEIVRRVPHEIRRTVAYHPHLRYTITDAIERKIDPDIVIAPYLSATEFAYWEAANSKSQLDDFAARIAARTLERKKVHDGKIREVLERQQQQKERWKERGRSLAPVAEDGPDE
jgi:hypothetical protein